MKYIILNNKSILVCEHLEKEDAGFSFAHNCHIVEDRGERTGIMDLLIKGPGKHGVIQPLDGIYVNSSAILSTVEAKNLNLQSNNTNIASPIHCKVNDPNYYTFCFEESFFVGKITGFEDNFIKLTNVKSDFYRNCCREYYNYSLLLEWVQDSEMLDDCCLNIKNVLWYRKNDKTHKRTV